MFHLLHQHYNHAHQLKFQTIMENRKLTNFTTLIMPLIVVLTTIILFLLIANDELSELFYTNLCFTLFMEIIFFGWLNVVCCRTSSFSTSFYSILGATALYYIAVGSTIMLLYSFIFSEIVHLRIYISVLVAITLIWFVIITIIAQTDSGYKTTTDKLKDDGRTLHFYATKIDVLANRYNRVCNNKGIKYQTESNNRTPLDTLKGKISFLTPNVLKNSSALNQLDAILYRCTELIDNVESAAAEQQEQAQEQMQYFVVNAINELDMLKNNTRR